MHFATTLASVFVCLLAFGTDFSFCPFGIFFCAIVPTKSNFHGYNFACLFFFHHFLVTDFHCLHRFYFVLNFFLCGLVFPWVSFAVFNVAKKMGFFNLLFIFNKCLRCVILTMISVFLGGGLIISLKPNFCWYSGQNACGYQSDRSKCLASFLKSWEQACKGLFSLWMSPFWVLPGLSS